VPGEFLAFSVLPGIGRAWYHWLSSSIGHLPQGDVNCAPAYSLTITITQKLLQIGLDRKIVLTAKLSWYAVHSNTTI